MIKPSVCVCVSEGGARGRWKVLKVESRSGVEQTEELLQSLHHRILQLHSRRQRLSELIQDLRHKVKLRPFTLLLQHPQCTVSTLFPPGAGVAAAEGLAPQGPECTAVM